MFLALGYLHAQFQLPKNSLAAQALTDYAQGVNQDLAQVRGSGQWPAVFSLPGVYPSRWTPVDSLVVQGLLTEELDLTTTPPDYALLERSLGAARTMDWFPVVAENPQTPYDPGPYAKSALTPIAARSAPSTGTTARSAVTEPEAQAAGTLLAQLSQLPPGQLHEYPDSNAWAAASPGPSPARRTRPPCSTTRRRDPASTTGTAIGVRCGWCVTQSRCAAPRPGR